MTGTLTTGGGDEGTRDGHTGWCSDNGKGTMRGAQWEGHNGRGHDE